ncbi:MAG TPA: DUF5946 family protein [Streptosporangiaceae bacterium]|nr:DUF5946 family protein [Streptosporangiaceae bacterium]
MRPARVHAYMHAAPTLIQHLVDSYAVQHAANPDQRNRQSAAVHLMSLCASLEQGIPRGAACGT